MTTLDTSIIEGEEGHLGHHEHIHKKLNGLVYDAIRDFGATGNGTTDDTVALQAWLDACTGSGDAATVTRAAVATAYLPPGNFKVTAPLTIKSVEGFRLIGASRRLSRFAPWGTMDSVLDIDGSLYGTFEDFCIKSGDAGVIDKCIELHWSAASHAHSSSNTFRNIFIADTTFRAGFGIGIDNANQVDAGTYINCHVRGQWSSGNTTTWQFGFQIGDGTAGNNLGHHFWGCEAYGNRYGVAFMGSSGTWIGGFTQGSEADLRVGTPNGPVSFEGVRSEDSERMVLVDGVTTSAMNLSLRDCEFRANAMNADGFWVNYKAGGVLRIDNCRVRGVTSGTAKIQGDSNGRIVLTGYSSQTAVTSVLWGGAAFFACGIEQTNSSGAVIDFLAGPWINGKMYWGPIPVSGAPTVELGLPVANVLAMGANDSFITGLAATGSRPSAVTVTKGAQFFDSTLNRPIWSDGANWVVGATKGELDAVDTDVTTLETTTADHETRLDTLETIQAWQAPSFQNSWVNYGTPYRDAGYWKDPFGVVHLRGVIKDGTLAATAFTLPSGYRPTDTCLFLLKSQGAGIGRASIGNDGQVNIADVTGGANTLMALDGITFRTT